MRIDIRPEGMAELAAMTPEAQREFLSKLKPSDLLLIDAAFEAWAAPGQLMPGGEGWRVWLMMGGRGFGKTRAGAEWVHQLALSGRRRIALVAASIDEARSVMVEGASGLMAVARRTRCKLKWEPALGRLTWPRGSVAQLFSGDHPDGLRGPEHDFAWCDELAKWRRAREAWDNLQMGLRRGVRPRALVTTTPRPLKLLEEIRDDALTVTTGGRTTDNMSLPDAFVDAMVRHYGGTRLGRQELDGEYLGEAEDALFPRGLMERQRLAEAPALFDRLVVGVDPPASSGGDACGIVVAGRSEGRLYVLADVTVEKASPERWARVVAGAVAAWNASAVIAEGNQGGEMVTSVLRAAGCSVPVKLVHARVGKVARAEPVATRFEAGTAHLVGTFPELEAELAGLGQDGEGGGGHSPDRADAMVWALTALGETRSGLPRVVRL